MALELVHDQYGSYWRGNEWGITRAQMELNATYIWNYLGSQGWSLQAVAGILGNTEFESGHNPGIWQNLEPIASHGYGIVQWTPSTKFTEWAQENGYPINVMYGQLGRILFERDNNIQWSTSLEYPISFGRYWNTHSHSAHWCGGAWFMNYERGPNPAVARIRENAAREGAYFLATQPQPTIKGPSNWVVYKRGAYLINET